MNITMEMKQAYDRMFEIYMLSLDCIEKIVQICKQQNNKEVTKVVEEFLSNLNDINLRYGIK